MSSDTVCRYNKFGYCKFGEKCFRKHENRTCKKVGCSISYCNLRHPRKCRYYLEFHYCKFGSFCKFSHEIEESEETKKEIEILQKEVKRLENNIKLMEAEIQNKSKEIKRMEEAFEQEKKEIDANNQKEVEFVRNEWHVTQMLFDLSNLVRKPE